MYLGHTFSRHFGVIWPSPATSERHVKAKARKNEKISKSGGQNRSPKSYFVSRFWCLAAKVCQRGPKCAFCCPGWSQGPSQVTNNEPKDTKINPKDPTEHPARSNFVESCATNCARNCISAMSYWVCGPRLNPHAHKCFHDARRCSRMGF